MATKDDTNKLVLCTKNVSNWKTFPANLIYKTITFKDFWLNNNPQILVS